MCMCVCCGLVCRELGIAIVPYSPLGRGFFAGYKPEAGNQDFRSVINIALIIISQALQMFSSFNFQVLHNFCWLMMLAT